MNRDRATVKIETVPKPNLPAGKPTGLSPGAASIPRRSSSLSLHLLDLLVTALATRHPRPIVIARNLSPRNESSELFAVRE
jgi:hypothetical protein